MRWFKATLLLLVVLAAPVRAYAQQGALAAPAPAQGASSPEAITLKVPVQLKDMVGPTAVVDCKVYGNDLNTELGSGRWTNVDLDGQFDGIVEIIVNPTVGSYFNGIVKSYQCSLEVSGQPNDYHGALAPPTQGTGGRPLAYLARPDRFFRVEVSGTLSGAVSGPGALQQ